MAADRVELTSEQLAALTPPSQGTPITASSMPAGGVGLAGWLSALKTALYDVWDSVTHRLLTKADQGAAGSEAWQVKGGVFRSEVTLARPNNATAYTANDAVTDSPSAPTALSFAGCARAAGGGTTLMQARMTINKVMGTTRYRLHLFRDTPASIPNDNDAFATTWANSSLRLGYVDFATPVVGGDCTDYYGTFVQTGAVPTVLVGTAIKGILQVLDGVTPAGTDQFKFVLTGFYE